MCGEEFACTRVRYQRLVHQLCPGASRRAFFSRNGAHRGAHRGRARAGPTHATARTARDTHHNHRQTEPHHRTSTSTPGRRGRLKHPCASTSRVFRRTYGTHSRSPLAGVRHTRHVQWPATCTLAAHTPISRTRPSCATQTACYESKGGDLRRATRAVIACHVSLDRVSLSSGPTAMRICFEDPARLDSELKATAWAQPDWLGSI